LAARGKIAVGIANERAKFFWQQRVCILAEIVLLFYSRLICRGAKKRQYPPQIAGRIRRDADSGRVIFGRYRGIGANQSPGGPRQKPLATTKNFSGSKGELERK